MEALLDNLNIIARDYWGAWLMLLFVGVLVFALNPKRKAEMEHHAQIPLRDDTPPDVEA